MQRFPHAVVTVLPRADRVVDEPADPFGRQLPLEALVKGCIDRDVEAKQASVFNPVVNAGSEIDRQGRLNSPSASDLKTRLCLAHGMKLAGTEHLGKVLQERLVDDVRAGR